MMPGTDRARAAGAPKAKGAPIAENDVTAGTKSARKHTPKTVSPLPEVWQPGSVGKTENTSQILV